MKTEHVNESLHLEEWWDVDIDIVIKFLVHAKGLGATHLNIEEVCGRFDITVEALDLIPTKKIG